MNGVTYHPEDNGKKHGEELGEKIKGLRESKSLSQYRLSKMASVPQSSISRLECGHKTGVSSRTLNRIAEALNTTIDYLLTDSGTALSAGTNATRWMNILQNVVNIQKNKVFILDPRGEVLASSSDFIKKGSNIERYLIESSQSALQSCIEEQSKSEVALSFNSGEKLDFIIDPVYMASNPENSTTKRVTAFVCAAVESSTKSLITTKNYELLLSAVRIEDDGATFNKTMSNQMIQSFEEINSICFIGRKDPMNDNAYLIQDAYKRSVDGQASKSFTFVDMESGGPLTDPKAIMALHATSRNSITYNDEYIAISCSMDGELTACAILKSSDIPKTMEGLYQSEAYFEYIKVIMKLRP